MRHLPSSWLGKHCRCCTRARWIFWGIAETQGLLDELEQIAPATVRQVVPKPISVTLLADVLRRLAEERVNIRDLRAILEALALVGYVERDPLNLAEFGPLPAAPAADPRAHPRRPRAVGRAARTANRRSHPRRRLAHARRELLDACPAAARDVVSAVRRALPSEPGETPLVVLTPARYPPLRAQARGARPARRARRVLRRTLARSRHPSSGTRDVGRPLVTRRDRPRRPLGECKSRVRIRTRLSRSAAPRQPERVRKFAQTRRWTTIFRGTCPLCSTSFLASFCNSGCVRFIMKPPSRRTSTVISFLSERRMPFRSLVYAYA